MAMGVAVMVRSWLKLVVVPTSDPCPKVNIDPEIKTIIRFSQAFETPFQNQAHILYMTQVLLTPKEAPTTCYFVSFVGFPQSWRMTGMSTLLSSLQPPTSHFNWEPEESRITLTRIMTTANQPTQPTQPTRDSSSENLNQYLGNTLDPNAQLHQWTKVLSLVLTPT